MTNIDVAIAELRQRRQRPGLKAWLRQRRPFDRRAIRDPDERDIYWARVRVRLAESDAAFLTRYSPREAEWLRPTPRLIG